MTTNRHSESARANGRKSRGPVTPAGKARSSRNGVRHGLATPHLSLSAAAAIILPGDDDNSNNNSVSALHRIHQELIQEFAPATSAEMLLVEEMAVARYRLQRAWLHEASLVRQKITELRETRSLFEYEEEWEDEEQQEHLEDDDDNNSNLSSPTPPSLSSSSSDSDAANRPSPLDETALAFGNLATPGNSVSSIDRYENRLSRQFDRTLRRLLDLRANSPAIIPSPSDVPTGDADEAEQHAKLPTKPS